MRSALRKTLDILELHGFRALVVRGTQKLRRITAAQWRSFLERRRWELEVVRDAAPAPVRVSNGADPLVTIVVIGETLRGTRNTLGAIARTAQGISYEVLLVADPTEQGIVDYARACEGLRIVACGGSYTEHLNAGAAAATGTYVAFVASGVVPTGEWLANLLAPLLADARIALSGAQLRSRDRRLLHAGGATDGDGSLVDVGTGDEPGLHQYAYLRDAEFVTPRFMLVRADALRAAGGFPEPFADEHRSAAGFARSLRSIGERVVYQPTAIAYDGDAIVAAAPHAAQSDLAARRLQGERRVLIVDTHVPFTDRDAGSRRIAALARLMRALQYDVLFLPDDGIAHEPYAAGLRACGIDVLENRDGGRAALAELSLPIDVAWVCRPELYERYAALLPASTGCKRIYDTVDLHHLREQRETAVTGRTTAWERTRDAEISYALEADRTIVCTPEEQSTLREYGIEAFVVPVVEAIRTTEPPPFQGRRDALFLGNYKHPPNVDAARYLCESVMPLLWVVDPNIELTLAGSEPTPEVLQLRSPRIRVTGYVADVTPLFDRARVFLAPLRYGAGMKGKIVQSLAMGLPTVTTSTGNEGTGFRDGYDILVADDAAAFSERALEAYRDELLWNRLATEGRASAARFSPKSVLTALSNALAFDA